MFSEKALLDTQVDVAKAATVNTVSHIANTYRKGGQYFPEQWIQATIATLVGFVAHGLVVSQVIKPKTGNAGVDAGLADVVKIGTVLAVSQAINSARTGPIDFPNAWVASTLTTLAAFFVFHVAVAKHIPNVEGHQNTVMDMSKVVFTSVAAQFVAGLPMDKDFFLTLGGTVAGFAVFSEVVQPRVFA